MAFMRLSPRRAPVRLSFIVGGALAIAFTAGSVGGVDALAVKSGSEAVTLTQILFQTASSGNPPSSGHNSSVGTSDGRIGSTTVHGAVRGTNSYPAFTGKWVMFDKYGAIRFSLTGHTVSSGRFAGTATITGGSGRYRHASGKLSFTARSESPSKGESSPVIKRKLSGTLMLR